MTTAELALQARQSRHARVIQSQLPELLLPVQGQFMLLSLPELKTDETLVLSPFPGAQPRCRELL